MIAYIICDDEIEEHEGEVGVGGFFYYRDELGACSVYPGCFYLTEVEAINFVLGCLKGDVIRAEKKHVDFMMKHHKTLHPDD